MIKSLKCLGLGAMLLCAANAAHAQSPWLAQSSVLKMRAAGPVATALGQEQGYKSCVQSLLKPK